MALGVAVSTSLVFGHEYVEPVPIEPAVHRSYPSGFIADGLRSMYHVEYVAQLQRVHAYIVSVAANKNQQVTIYIGDSTGDNHLGLEVDSSGSVQDEFIAGWRAGGGVEAWLPYVINVVVPCESGWRVYAESPSGLYHGLGQWHSDTWSGIATITGLYDIYNPFHQGFNMGFKTARDGGGAWSCW